MWHNYKEVNELTNIVAFPANPVFMATIKRYGWKILIVKFKIPYTNFECFIKFYTNSLLQIFFDFCDKN